MACCHCSLIIICHLLHLRQIVPLSDTDNIFTRHDRDAYLAVAAGGRRQVKEGRNQRPPSYDDPGGCTTYLAPSSIPNSGLGMYTTVPYKQGELLLFPEIGNMLADRERDHHGEKLLSSYHWRSSLLNFGKFEAEHGESLVPGLGMLTNSHLGLVNVKPYIDYEFQRWRDGTDSLDRTESKTLHDAGRGAHTHHTNVRFEAEKDIDVGEELFVMYGDSWFTAREHKIGIVPGKEHFQVADGALRNFYFERRDMVRWDDPASHNIEEYDRLLAEALMLDKRLRAALPNELRDVPIATEMGTARFSAQDSIRSKDWLEENGACLDNLISGATTIPQAGRGAFVTRFIARGGVIATTPVVTIDREELFLWEEVETTKNEATESTNNADGVTFDYKLGHQLLLNYCYGHVNSSLLFYPYSPTINFINHGGVRQSNAEIRWSTYSYHKSEWIDSTLKETNGRTRAGLMFDIIATRDLRRGEEVLLNYGKAWENSWDQHVREWMTPVDEFIVADGQSHYNNMTDRLNRPTVTDFNMVETHPIVRTITEQLDDPYPPNIMTVCHLHPPEDCVETSVNTDGYCWSRYKRTHDAIHIFPCTITSRLTIEGMDWYTALVDVSSIDVAGEKKLSIVEYIPRSAVLFTDKPYTKDQYAHGAFRHEVGLPDGLMLSLT